MKNDEKKLIALIIGFFTCVVIFWYLTSTASALDRKLECYKTCETDTECEACDR